MVGHSVVIEKDEVVHTLTVAGGSTRVRGIVTGDMAVAGGSVVIEEGARVFGDIAVFGGSVKIAKGARVDGDIATTGGSVKREEGAIVSGEVVEGGKHDHGKIRVSVDDENGVSTHIEKTREDDHHSSFVEKVHAFGQSVSKMALLFVFGCVLLALTTRRMDRLRVEAAARPMRSFAMGILASGAALVSVVVLCVTVIGVPMAIFATVAGVLAVYGAIAAVLTTFGAAVLGHKTQNPYVHLLFGCAALLVTLPIPYLGGLVSAAVTFVAIGTLVATRFGGTSGDKRPASGLV